MSGSDAASVSGEVDGDRSIIAGGMRLRFLWRKDRWFHELAWRQEDAWVPFASAHPFEISEGNESNVIVPNPTYQELHLQADGPAILALLVGQRGPHHFSAAFRVEGEGQNATVEVDLADRCRSAVSAFAATYLVLASSGDLNSADPEGASWNVGTGGRWKINPLLGNRISAAEHGRRLTTVQIDAPIMPGHSTHRVCYRWSWIAPPST